MNVLRTVTLLTGGLVGVVGCGKRVDINHAPIKSTVTNTESTSKITNIAINEEDKKILEENDKLLSQIFNVSPEQKAIQDKENTLYPLIMKWVVLSRNNPHLEKEVRELFGKHLEEASKKNYDLTSTIGMTIAEFAKFPSSTLERRLEGN